jgi:GR25 family glycosyltransferase involved in LPS biosynthesis
MKENLYAGFVNMDHRKDRLIHMRNQLEKAGIEAVRHRGMPWKEVPKKREEVAMMIDRTPGAIGCFHSQLQVMLEAWLQYKHALVMEDDCVFCSDFQKRLDHLDRFVENREWDVLWLGGTFHVPTYWHTGKHHLLPDTTWRRDAEQTDDPRVMRTYGAFSTYAYIVNFASIQKILYKLEEHMPRSIGIDYSFIALGPELKCFAFVPGCVRQMDNKSDIGKGYTIFSNFAKLNGNEENSRYWYQDRMEDFDPLKFDWKDAKNKTT